MGAILVIVIVAAVALVVFLIIKNNRDRRDYERFLNREEPREEDEPENTI